MFLIKKQEQIRKEQEKKTIENKNFSSDYFSPNETNWINWLSKFKNQKDLKFLEIGSYEGKSALWLLRNFESMKITCVDTFEGGLDAGAPSAANDYNSWLLQYPAGYNAVCNGDFIPRSVENGIPSRINSAIFLLSNQRVRWT